MTETALQPDTEPVPPVDALDEPLDRREATMEEIAATRLNELREDGVEVPPAGAEEADAVDGETPEPEDEDAEPAREPLPGDPPKANSGQPTVNLSPERETRKRTAVQPPTPRSAQPSVAPAQPKPDSEAKQRSNVIAEMRKARGQA